MEGMAHWSQLTFVSSLLAIVAVAAFLAAWRIQSLRSLDQVRATEQITAIKSAFETRIASIEIFNAGTMVVLEHMKEFREDIKAQFDTLNSQRSEDMAGIHRRLDALHNSARVAAILEREDNEAKARLTKIDD